MVFLGKGILRMSDTTNGGTDPDAPPGPDAVHRGTTPPGGGTLPDTTGGGGDTTGGGGS
jgi:hypothetical protein